jgi:hypothetical protein
MNTDSNIPIETLRKQAWDYFQLHASQRLTTFNFYIVLSSVITTGLVSTFQKDYKLPYAGIVLGFLLSLFSFIFWKLDSRNKELIKHAEAALRSFETKAQLEDVEGIPDEMKIFSREKYFTDKSKKNNSWWPSRRHLSYSSCFGGVFLCFGLVGIIGLITTIILN